MNLLLAVGTTLLIFTGVCTFFAFRRILSRREDDVVDRDQFNIQLHREHQETVLAEEDDTDQLADELAVTLLTDIPEHTLPVESHRSTFLAPFYILAFLVPCMAGALYWFSWGDPAAIPLVQVQEMIKNAQVADDFKVVEELLVERTRSHPGESTSWFYLIGIHSLLNRPLEVMRVHQQAENLGHQAFDADVEYVKAAFALRSIKLTELDRKIVDRVLTIDPSNVPSLLAEALIANASNDYETTNHYLERLLQQQLPQQLRLVTEQMQANAREQMAEPARAKVSVMIRVEDELPKQKWLTVFAKSRESQIPLAVVRRPLGTNSTFNLILDDSVSMMQATVLSSVTEAQITARLSETETATLHPTDIEQVSGWLEIGPDASTEFVFDEQEIRNEAIVHVSLSSQVTIDRTVPVFVIVREEGIEGPPLAVRKLAFEDLPLDISIGEDDVMLRSASPRELGALTVSARAAVVGQLMRQPGDLESDTVVTNMGSRIRLQLNRVVPGDAEF